MNISRLILAIAALAIVLNFPIEAKDNGQLIKNVSISKESFSPSFNETVSVSFLLTSPGLLNAVVIDRDGFSIATLAQNKKMEAGKYTLVWNGKTNQGGPQIVPDESYSFKLDLTATGKTETYFPANRVHELETLNVDFYDWQSGLLGFTLKKPSRVHIQAGSAVYEKKTKRLVGPVMKTVLYREPRPRGKNQLFWNGYNENSEIYIPELSNFLVQISASPLPENSVITVNNGSQKFIDYAMNRSGKSLFTFQVRQRHHHMGLSSLEDAAPYLKITPLNATRISSQHPWTVEGESIKISGSLDGATSRFFAAQPGILEVFLDGKPHQKIKPSGSKFDVSIPLQNVAPGTHILAFDWGSNYGPTTVNAFRFKIDKPVVAQKGSVKK